VCRLDIFNEIVDEGASLQWYAQLGDGGEVGARVGLAAADRSTGEQGREPTGVDPDVLECEINTWQLEVGEHREADAMGPERAKASQSIGEDAETGVIERAKLVQGRSCAATEPVAGSQIAPKRPPECRLVGGRARPRARPVSPMQADGIGWKGWRDFCNTRLNRRDGNRVEVQERIITIEDDSTNVHSMLQPNRRLSPAIFERHHGILVDQRGHAIVAGERLILWSWRHG